MKLLKRVRWVYLLLSVFLMSIGVCLIAWPAMSISMLCYIVGGGLIVFGLMKLVGYFVRELETMVEQYDFAIGVLSVLGGCVLIVQPDQLLVLLPQVLGIYVLVDCIFKMQVALDAKRLYNGLWYVMPLVILACFAWGLCLIFQPFDMGNNLPVLLGGGLIADSLQNLAAVAFIAVTVRKPAAEGGPVARIPDPMYDLEMEDQTRSKNNEPIIPLHETLDSGVQIKDVIDGGREKSNAPAGIGSILGFFSHNKQDDKPKKRSNETVDTDVDFDDEGDIY